jgi:hypothetical protein
MNQILQLAQGLAVGVIAVIAVAVQADLIWLIAALLGADLILEIFNDLTPRNGH